MLLGTRNVADAYSPNHGLHVQGFTPFSKVDPARLLDRNRQVRHPDSVDESMDDEVIPPAGQPRGRRKRLSGQPISVKIVQVRMGHQHPSHALCLELPQPD